MTADGEVEALRRELNTMSLGERQFWEAALAPLFKSAAEARLQIDDLRRAIFGSSDYDPSLTHGCFVEMAHTTEAARKGALARLDATTTETAKLRERAEKAERRVADLERASANMLTAAELRAERDRLRELVGGAQGILMNCDVETGICCCGDAMENHGNPMDCGHSPTDQGAYSAQQWLEAARETLGSPRASLADATPNQKDRSNG